MAAFDVEIRQTRSAPARSRTGPSAACAVVVRTSAGWVRLPSWIPSSAPSPQRASQYACGRFLNLLHIAVTLGSNAIHLHLAFHHHWSLTPIAEFYFLQTSLHHRSSTPLAEFYSFSLQDILTPSRFSTGERAALAQRSLGSDVLLRLLADVLFQSLANTLCHDAGPEGESPCFVWRFEFPLPS